MDDSDLVAGDAVEAPEDGEALGEELLKVAFRREALEDAIAVVAPFGLALQAGDDGAG